MLSDNEIFDLLNIKENSNLEFKKAEDSFSFDKLCGYSVVTVTVVPDPSTNLAGKYGLKLIAIKH